MPARGRRLTSESKLMDQVTPHVQFLPALGNVLSNAMKATVLNSCDNMQTIAFITLLTGFMAQRESTDSQWQTADGICRFSEQLELHSHRICEVLQPWELHPTVLQELHSRGFRAAGIPFQ